MNVGDIENALREGFMSASFVSLAVTVANEIYVRGTYT